MEVIIKADIESITSTTNEVNSKRFGKKNESELQTEWAACLCLTFIHQIQRNLKETGFSPSTHRVLKETFYVPT